MNIIAHLNYAAIIVSALAYFGLGSLWYSKLMFLNPWMKALNISPDAKDKRHPGMMLGITFLSSMVISFAMALLVVLTGSNGIQSGLLLGAIAAIGFGSTAALINALFEDRTIALMLINGGYHLAGCMIVGLILSIWRSV